MKKSLLSVVVPTFERCELVVRLAGEILEQLREGDELIISDDGSGDGTAEALGKLHGVRVVRQEGRLGMVGNWNYCLNAGSNPWVCLIHDDDRLIKGGLEVIRRVCGIAQGPAVVAHSAWNREDEIGATPELCYEFREAGRRASLNAKFCPSGVTIHRDVLKEMGGFTAGFPYSADIEYFARLCARFPSFVIQNPRVIEYVVHDTNHQFATWKSADFLEQLEDVETASIAHAGLERREAQQLLQDRMADNLFYMLKTARKLGLAEQVQVASKRLRGMRRMGNRTSMGLWLEAKFGWYPRHLGD